LSCAKELREPERQHDLLAALAVDEDGSAGEVEVAEPD
jgi:hypothetical protein